MPQRLVLLVGLPGSGKSTYARAHGLPVISSDDLRQLLLDDATEQSQNRRIFGLLRQLIRMRFEMGRPLTVLDATNLTARERRPWLRMAEMYGVAAEAVYFTTPAEVCKQRNRARSRVVPEEVMDRFARKLQPPTTAEGFTQVTVVSTESATAAAPTATTASE